MLNYTERFDDIRLDYLTGIVRGSQWGSCGRVVQSHECPQGIVKQPYGNTAYVECECLAEGVPASFALRCCPQVLMLSLIHISEPTRPY